jgi:hypothetical protein
MEFLLRAKELSLSASAIEKLIAIDYFADFGNIPTLKKEYEMFSFLNFGTAKSVSKEKLPDEFKDIFEQGCDGKRKDGSEAKSYSIQYMPFILREIEERIKSFSYQDYGYKEKMREQVEILGYTDITTNKEEDRQKLLITDVRELNGKNGTWAYGVSAKSIGSGKISNWTVRARTFNTVPIQQGDIIYVLQYGKEKEQYWYLYEYNKIFY